MTTTPIHRRRALGLSIALAAAAFTGGAAAQAVDKYPARPIHIVVPYPAGGTTDQLARAVAQPLQESLGQVVIIDNKPGSGGILGTEFAARQPADGYTLLFGNSGPSATSSLMRKLPYDVLKDFRPLSAVVTVPLILSVSAASPYKTTKEFLAAARAPGSQINYATTGLGGSSHLASEFFNELAGTKLQHIPYAGGAPAVTALAGGQVQMAFLTGLDGAAMQQAGRIRYLAVASPTRTDVLPGLPAVAEDLPGFHAVVWFGMLAPKNVPDAIADRLSAAIAAAVQRPEVRKLLVDRNVEPRGTGPQELDRMIRAELEQWGPVVRKANITMD